MATALTNPELFWALREGGGNLAAVTSIEIDLLLVSEIYGAAAPFLDTVGIASHDRDRDHQCRPRGPDAGLNSNSDALTRDSALDNLLS